MVEKLKMNYQGIHFLKSKEKYIISNQSNYKYNKLQNFYVKHAQFKEKQKKFK